MNSYTDNLIPIMKSDTSPSGRAFASSFSQNGAYMAFDNNDTYGFVSGSGSVGHLGYEFVNPVRIGKYIVRSLSAPYFPNMPKNWTFEGSNDGSSWSVLDTRINQTWTTTFTDIEYIIDYSKAKRFKMYRLNWTANNGGSQVVINELKMFGVDYFDKFLISTGVDTVSVSHFSESNPIPIMTAGTVNGVTITESLINAGAYNGWKAFDGVSSVNTSCWAAPKVPTIVEPQWIMIKLDKKRPIYRYELTGQAGSPLRSPKDWTFEGSNDGKSWTVLDTQTGQTGWADNVYKKYSTSNKKRYLYYRVMITTNCGDVSFVCIGEMKIYQLESSIVTYAPDLDETSFVKYGMSKSDAFDLQSPVRETINISNTSEALGSGKVFKKKFDTNKIPIKKAIIT
ncbi:discoidin domain-containing protein [Paenibacillus taichungensis]